MNKGDTTPAAVAAMFHAAVGAVPSPTSVASLHDSALGKGKGKDKDKDKGKDKEAGQEQGQGADEQAFDRFMTALSTIGGAPSAPKINTSLLPSTQLDAQGDQGDVGKIDSKKAGQQNQSRIQSQLSHDQDQDEDQDEDDEEDEGFEITIDEAFRQLAGPDKTVVTLAAVTEWEVVSELIEAGVVTTQGIAALFQQAGARGRKTLTLDQFELFLDMLAPLAGDGEEVGGEDEDEDDGNVDVDVAMGSGSTSTSGSLQATQQPSSQSKRPLATADEDDDDDEEEDQKLVEAVFKGIAGTKKYVTAKVSSEY